MQVAKWGNSLAVRLPAELVRKLGLKEGDEIALTAGDDRERKKKSGFFVGEVMKATRGRADGRAVNELLARRSAG